MELKVNDFVYDVASQFDGFDNKGFVRQTTIKLKAIINEIVDNLALIEYFEDAQKIVGYKFKWVSIDTLSV